MHLTPVTLGAAGDSQWIPLNPLLVDPESVGLGLTFSYDANLTASVQYTYDDPTQSTRTVTITRVGAVATVNDPGHNLNANDSITVYSDPTGTFGPIQATPQTPPVNWDIAAITDANNYTVAVPNAGSLGPDICQIQSFRVFTHPTMGNQVGIPPARIDGGFQWQVGAYRLKVSGYTAGKATLSGQAGKGY